LHLASILPAILLANQSIIQIIILIIKLFIHLPEYQVIVYTGPECKYAVLPIYIDSHLSSLCHNYSKEQQEQVIQQIDQIQELIQNNKELGLFKFSKPSSPAIPELRAVMSDRLQYRLYSYICQNEHQMQAYCKDVYR
jgi:hypothetical protein